MLHKLSSVAFTIHVARSLQNRSYAVFKLHMVSTLQNTVRTDFTLLMAHTAREFYFFFLYVAYDFHIAEFCFCCFILYVTYASRYPNRKRNVFCDLEMSNPPSYPILRMIGPKCFKNSLK